MSETQEIVTTPAFTDPGLMAWLDDAPAGAMDAVAFGIIGMDADGIVTVYNSLESRLAGLTPDRVLGRHLFAEVAPCMDNDLVADRFALEPELDATIQYTLTLRMKPTRVQLRLLQHPAASRAYVLVLRQGNV